MANNNYRVFLYQPEVVSTDYDSMFSAPSHFKSENNNNEELDQTYETLNKNVIFLDDL
jgi:hypothetical protein